MIRRALALLLLIPLLMAAAPQPQGTLTLTSTTPVTFTATTSHVGRRDHVWVSMHCWDANGNVTYYGEEIERNGFYVMDDTVWVLWTGTVAQGSCRALLLFRDESKPGEVVLDDSGFFQAP